MPSPNTLAVSMRVELVAFVPPFAAWIAMPPSDVMARNIPRRWMFL